MFFGGVYIGMSENICYKIDIACFPVQIGAIGTAQFVRGDLFERCDDMSVFFNQVFYRADIHAFALHGKEECLLASFFRNDSKAFIKIVLKCIFYF